MGTKLLRFFTDTYLAKRQLPIYGIIMSWTRLRP